MNLLIEGEEERYFTILAQKSVEEYIRMSAKSALEDIIEDLFRKV